MPFILVVLFTIALLVTLTGLFLSPRSQPRDPRSGELVPAERRRVVDAIPERRRADEITTAPGQRRRQIAEQSIRSGRRVTEVSTSYIPARASRGTVASGITSSVAVQSPGLSVPRPGFIPDSWKDLFDRLGSWKVILPGLCALFLVFLYLFSLLFPQQVAWTSVWFGSPQTSVKPTAQAGLPADYDASKALQRISQLSSAQYQSTQEYNAWAYSACSAASMTEVINAYGHHYLIANILEIEAKIHEITPEEGLLEESGIAHTGSQFGFKTTWGHNLSLDQVIAAANAGTPVIVSFPPDRYAGGHILVVRGGDKNNVDLADSSLYNRTVVSRSFFLQYWEGFYAIMKPA